MGNCKSRKYTEMPPSYDGIAGGPADVTVRAVINTLVNHDGFVSGELARTMLAALRAAGVVVFPLGGSHFSTPETTAIVRAVAEGYFPEDGQCVAEVNPVSWEVEWLAARPKLTPVRQVALAYWRARRSFIAAEHVCELVSKLSETQVEGMSTDWAMTVAEQIAERRNDAATFVVQGSKEHGWAAVVG